MRSFRILLLAICTSLVALLAPAANAANTARADVFSVVAPDDSDISRVVVLCTGRGSEGTVRVVVSCDVYDTSTNPSIHHSRSTTGPAGVCLINAFNLRAPIEYCATVTATFLDNSTQSDTRCAATPGTPPAHNPPPVFTPKTLECYDPVGLPV